jgi:hypothetical protein
MLIPGPFQTLRAGALLMLAAVSCQGKIGGDDRDAARDVQRQGWPAFGPTQSFQLRRLTVEQYANTVRTLLGVSTDGAPSIEPVPSVQGFPAIGASSVAVSGAGVAKFEEAARYFAHAALGATGPREKLSPCTPSGPTDLPCFTSFVTEFGRRAFRRPLTSDEVASYAGLASSVATTLNDAWAGVEAVASAFLQSPNFVYLTEVGEPDPDSPGHYRYTDYEMASRLSYFLTNDMPDDDLFEAAESGALSTAEGIQTQASRLLALPAARDAVRGFFSALLGLDALKTMARTAELFPKFTPTLGASMSEETLLGLEDLVFAKDGDYRRVFDQQTTFVNAELASLYGVPAPAASGFAQVTLPASAKRVGLLGQAGVLAPRDHADGTAPTRRGLFVLTRLLCEDLPLAPPANLAVPPAPTGMLTARQQLGQHATNPVCASCHSKTDPVGLSLEHFDAIGEYRETDRGMTIDDAGKIGDTSFQGLAGLAAFLRDSPALGPCLIQSIYHVAIGHRSTEFDQATFASMVETFERGGSRILPLLAAIIVSDGFRYLPAPTN